MKTYCIFSKEKQFLIDEVDHFKIVDNHINLFDESRKFIGCFSLNIFGICLIENKENNNV